MCCILSDKKTNRMFGNMSLALTGPGLNQSLIPHSVYCCIDHTLHTLYTMDVCQNYSLWASAHSMRHMPMQFSVHTRT